MSEQTTTRPARQRGKAKAMGLDFSANERPVIEALKILQDSPLDQGDGILIEAGDKWNRLVAMVNEGGGKGEMTIKLIVGKEGTRMLLTGDFTVKEPKTQRGTVKLYAGPRGLSLADPDQYELPFEEGEGD